LLVSVVTALGLVLGAFGASPAQAAATSKSLAVPTIKQINTEWCWAASAQMLAMYNGHSSANQCDIVKATLGLTTCPNQAATEAQTRSALTKAGLSWAYSSSPLTFPTIKLQIDASKAMEYVYAYKNGSGEHAVVIVAYWQDPTFAPPEDQYVYWNDPLDQLKKSGTMNYLASNPVWYGGFYVYNIVG